MRIVTPPHVFTQQEFPISSSAQIYCAYFSLLCLNEERCSCAIWLNIDTSVLLILLSSTGNVPYTLTGTHGAC